jgi:hypothetical protein
MTLAVHDSAGALVQALAAPAGRGIQRVVWDLRHAGLPVRSGGGEDDDEGPRATTPGPLVLPGRYRVRLTHGGAVQEQWVVVRDDPRLTVTRAQRAAWTAFHRQVAAQLARVAPLAARLREAGGSGTDATARDRARQGQELLARLSGLYGAVGRWTGAPTADQRSELAYYTQMADTLSR